jgi:hypothetical protein
MIGTPYIFHIPFSMLDFASYDIWELCMHTFIFLNINNMFTKTVAFNPSVSNFAFILFYK